MSYGANVPDLFRHTAVYIDKVLKGTDPAELPVEQPVLFDFVVNLRTAKAAQAQWVGLKGQVVRTK